MVLARTADLTVSDEVDAVIASAVADLGRLDVLVNNAGCRRSAARPEPRTSLRSPA
ncbi:SDR family oxidoreductase [Streptomyces sp. NBC_00885]|uniref:SDR family NAD(P)-dependent oxidoreductase n=1 Tax=Streptomyces sp. NBC_00885 TaxID=2975857 RepID=UPI003863FC97|nr:SDR family oxidoreductase [Streptomyces sp. NBC_00885]